MDHQEPIRGGLSPEGWTDFLERDQEQRRQEDTLMAELPDPKVAPEFLTKLMADEVRRDFIDNLVQGRDIDPLTGRMIAYSLIKYAPEGALVGALTEYYTTGHGSHADLRAEYVPLYRNPRMEPEGQLLLDILGTHLYRHEHPDRGQQPRDYPVRGTVLTAFNRSDDTRLHFPLQYRRGLDEDDLESVAAEMCHHVQVKGDPFLAYLRLPGIDASAGDLLQRFALAYQGVAGEGIDPDGLTRGTNEMFGHHQPSWEAVEIGGQVHVFYH